LWGETGRREGLTESRQNELERPVKGGGSAAMHKQLKIKASKGNLIMGLQGGKGGGEVFLAPGKAEQKLLWTNEESDAIKKKERRYYLKYTPSFRKRENHKEL